VAATLVDGILIGLVFAIILTSAGMGALSRSLVELLFQAVYQIVMLGGYGGRTIGNRVARTRTVNAGTGALPGYEQAVPRALVQAALAFTIIGGFIDILWPLWDNQNQTLHDKAAGTVVLRTDIYS
jgi:uncharacterized RDD family membrane protein YckC